MVSALDGSTAASVFRFGIATRVGTSEPVTGSWFGVFGSDSGRNGAGETMVASVSRNIAARSWRFGGRELSGAFESTATCPSGEAPSCGTRVVSFPEGTSSIARFETCRKLNGKGRLSSFHNLGGRGNARSINDSFIVSTGRPVEGNSIWFIAIPRITALRMNCPSGMKYRRRRGHGVVTVR